MHLYTQYLKIFIQNCSYYKHLCLIIKQIDLKLSAEGIKQKFIFFCLKQTRHLSFQNDNNHCGNRCLPLLVHVWYLTAIILVKSKPNSFSVMKVSFFYRFIYKLKVQSIRIVTDINHGHTTMQC